MTPTPSNISHFIMQCGFWYTYWSLREETNLTRKRTLWLMWVGWWYSKPFSRKMEYLFG